MDNTAFVTSYKKYNCILSNNRHYAVPEILGDVDVQNLTDKQAKYVLSADSLSILKTTIDQRGDPRLSDMLYALAPLTELALPEVIEIEPIHTCNLRCIMCHVSYEKLTKNRLDIGFLKQLKGLEGRWAQLGSSHEPTAHPYFADIIDGLTELDMDISFITNGSLLTSKLINRIKHGRIKLVTFSFDGATRETYEKIRRRGKFQETIDRFIQFKEAIQKEVPYVSFRVNYTVVASNLHEIVDAVTLWEKYGFDHIIFTAMVIRDEDPYLKSESIEPHLDKYYSELDKAAELVINKKYNISLGSPWYRKTTLRKKYPNNFHDSYGLAFNQYRGRKSYLGIYNFYQEGYYPGMKKDCRSPFKHIRIDFNGDVHLCHKYQIGSIYKDSLINIWESKRANEYRNLLKKQSSICNGCEVYKFSIKANAIDYSKEKNFFCEDALVKEHAFYFQPKLIKTFKDYNFVGYQSYIWAIPHTLGELNIADEDLNSLPGVLKSKNINSLEKMIDPQIMDFPFIVKKIKNVFTKNNNE